MKTRQFFNFVNFRETGPKSRFPKVPKSDHFKCCNTPLSPQNEVR